MNNITIDDSPEARIRYAIFKAVEFGARLIIKKIEPNKSYVWCADNFETMQGYHQFCKWLEGADFGYVFDAKGINFLPVTKPVEQQPIRINLPLLSKSQKRAEGLKQRLTIEAHDGSARIFIEAGETHHAAFNYQLTSSSFDNPTLIDSSVLQQWVDYLIDADGAGRIRRG